VRGWSFDSSCRPTPHDPDRLSKGLAALPDWSPEGSLETMAELEVATAIVSVSTPGTTLVPKATDAVALARDLNDYGADPVAWHRDYGVLCRPSHC
jgi:hypothetical protein